MNMTRPTRNDARPSKWKPQTYIIGTVVGTILGLLSAYLYARAAEEEAERKGGRPDKIPTSQLLTLGLAALGLIRQVTELGRPSKKK
jgi:H+/Cl- antiporter ClcA